MVEHMRLIALRIYAGPGFGGISRGALIAGDELTLSADATVTNDCLDERNEGVYPPTFSSTPAVGYSYQCCRHHEWFCLYLILYSVAGSDVISIKRLIGNPVTGGLDANRFYMATNTQQAHLFRGNETAPSEAAMPMRQIWEYQHHVYYLSPNGRGGFELHKRILTADGGSWLISGALVDGIERMVLLFGVDTSNVPDGRVKTSFPP